MLRGERVVLSDQDCDAIGQMDGDLIKRFATLPNPNQLGLLDAWIGFLKAEAETKPNADLPNPEIEAKRDTAGLHE